MVDLVELAKKIEHAEQPDRALDWEIHLRRGLDGVGYYGSHPRYTSSLDDATSLIPSEHDWIIEHVNGGLTIGARVGHNDPDRTSWGSTAPLALCAAALKAEASVS